LSRNTLQFQRWVCIANSKAKPSVLPPFPELRFYSHSYLSKIYMRLFS
jgi:hypothetical protein